MLHNDIQIRLSNHGKWNANEHPIDGILIGYSKMNNQIKNSQANYRGKNYKTETKDIIQRQRIIKSFLNKSDDNEPSIRKPTTLATTSKELSITPISSPQLLFAELNEQSTHNHNRQQTIKKEFDHQSLLLIRRQRATIEHHSPPQQMSDITNLSGNQLSIATPSSYIFRTKPSRVVLPERSSSRPEDRLSSSRLKPLNSSKIISEGNHKQSIFPSKSTHQNISLSTHTWTPRLSDPGPNHIRTSTSTLRAKAHLSKYFLNRHQLHSERMNANSKTNSIQDLFIAPRTRNNPYQAYEMNKKARQIRIIVEDWDDPKSHHNGILDEDESISTDGNSSTSTYNSPISVRRYNHSSSLSPLSNPHDLFSFHDNSKQKLQRSSTKQNISRRRAYNIALPPLTEYHDDNETSNEYH